VVNTGVPRSRAPELARAPFPVVAEQRHGPRARPEPESVRFLVGLVVPRGRHLQDSARSGGRDEGEASELERRAQLDAPLRSDLPCGLGQERQVEACLAAAFYLATSIDRDSRITITFT
jgi:hypothetical protein